MLTMMMMMVDDDGDEDDDDQDERKMIMLDAEDKEENDDVEEENQSQDREAHFVRACAGEMRMDMVQEEPLRMEICTGNGRGHQSGDIGILCEPAHSKCAWTFHKRHFACRNLQEKCRTTKTSGDIVLCEPAQSKRTWTFHKRHADFCKEIYRKKAGHVWEHLD